MPIVYGCVTKTGQIIFENLESCLDSSTCRVVSGIHAGQVALTLSGAENENCNDTFYGCVNKSTNRFRIGIPHCCCITPCGNCEVGETPAFINLSLSGGGWGYACQWIDKYFNPGYIKLPSGTTDGHTLMRAGLLPHWPAVPAWNGSATYNRGNTVRHNGYYWQCDRFNISGSEYEPGVLGWNSIIPGCEDPTSCTWYYYDSNTFLGHFTLYKPGNPDCLETCYWGNPWTCTPGCDFLPGRNWADCRAQGTLMFYPGPDDGHYLDTGYIMGTFLRVEKRAAGGGLYNLGISMTGYADTRYWLANGGGIGLGAFEGSKVIPLDTLPGSTPQGCIDTSVSGDDPPGGTATAAFNSCDE